MAVRGEEQRVSAEELAAYAAKALNVFGIAVDPRVGTAYLIAKRSKLELDVIVGVDFGVISQLAVIYIQVAQSIRDAAQEAAMQAEARRVTGGGPDIRGLPGRHTQ